MECRKTFEPEFATEEECELTSAKCIIHENAIAYLGLQPNSTLEEVIQALLFSLINTRTRLKNLEQP